MPRLQATCIVTDFNKEKPWCCLGEVVEATFPSDFSAVLRTALRYSGVLLLRPLTVPAEVWPSKTGGPGSLIVLYRVQMY